VYLGRISRERWLWAGAKFMAAGLVALGLSLLLEGRF
jgi:hypothetical protein